MRTVLPVSESAHAQGGVRQVDVHVRRAVEVCVVAGGAVDGDEVAREVAMTGFRNGDGVSWWDARAGPPRRHTSRSGPGSVTCNDCHCRSALAAGDGSFGATPCGGSNLEPLRRVAQRGRTHAFPRMGVKRQAVYIRRKPLQPDRVGSFLCGLDRWVVPSASHDRDSGRPRGSRRGEGERILNQRSEISSDAVTAAFAGARDTAFHACRPHAA